MMTSVLEGWLIELDECPAVWPIKIRDTARHAFTKAVLVVTIEYIKDAAGAVQLCAGQIYCYEAAIHSVLTNIRR